MLRTRLPHAVCALLGGVAVVALLAAPGGVDAKPRPTKFRSGYYSVEGSFHLNGKSSFQATVSSCYDPSQNSSTDSFGGTIDDARALIGAPTVTRSPGTVVDTGWTYDHAETSVATPNGSCDGTDARTIECEAKARKKRGAAGGDQSDAIVRFSRDSKDYAATLELPDPRSTDFTRSCPGSPTALGPDPGFLEADPPLTIKLGEIDPDRFDHEHAVTLTKKLSLTEIRELKDHACPAAGIRKACTLDLNDATVKLTFRPVDPPKKKRKG
jgi:hypothetical protein